MFSRNMKNTIDIVEPLSLDKELTFSTFSWRLFDWFPRTDTNRPLPALLIIL